MCFSNAVSSEIKFGAQENSRIKYDVHAGIAMSYLHGLFVQHTESLQTFVGLTDPIESCAYSAP